MARTAGDDDGFLLCFENRGKERPRKKQVRLRKRAVEEMTCWAQNGR